MMTTAEQFEAQVKAFADGERMNVGMAEVNAENGNKASTPQARQAYSLLALAHIRIAEYYARVSAGARQALAAQQAKERVIQ